MNDTAEILENRRIEDALSLVGLSASDYRDTTFEAKATDESMSAEEMADLLSTDYDPDDDTSAS